MAKKDKSSGDKMAEVMTAHPAHLAAGTIDSLLENVVFSDGEESYAPTVRGFVTAMQEGTAAIKSGDLAHLEAMLYAQTETLNMMFHMAVTKAQSAEYLTQVQLHTDIALKAQNHCRRTISTIADLKQPKKTMFVKQQHNTLNQQINSENKSQSENEVLEGKNGNQLESGAAQTTIGYDAGMEALGISNGSKNTRGEKAVIRK